MIVHFYYVVRVVMVATSRRAYLNRPVLSQ